MKLGEEMQLDAFLKSEWAEDMRWLLRCRRSFRVVAALHGERGEVRGGACGGALGLSCGVRFRTYWRDESWGAVM